MKKRTEPNQRPSQVKPTHSTFSPCAESETQRGGFPISYPYKHYHNHHKCMNCFRRNSRKERYWICNEIFVLNFRLKIQPFNLLSSQLQIPSLSRKQAIISRGSYYIELNCALPMPMPNPCDVYHTKHEHNITLRMWQESLKSSHENEKNSKPMPTPILGFHNHGSSSNSFHFTWKCGTIIERKLEVYLVRGWPPETIRTRRGGKFRERGKGKPKKEDIFSEMKRDKLLMLMLLNDTDMDVALPSAP